MGQLLPSFWWDEDAWQGKVKTLGVKEGRAVLLGYDTHSSKHVPAV